MQHEDRVQSPFDLPLRLPAPFAWLVSKLPQWPPSLAFATALNVALRARLDPAALHALDGRIVRIVVRDAGLALTLRCAPTRFEPTLPGAAADVTISACAYDFLALAARSEDPDTLFFARRLVIEGDTETGLVVKNMLDATELPEAARLLAALEAALRGLHRRLFPSASPR